MLYAPQVFRHGLVVVKWRWKSWQKKKKNDGGNDNSIFIIS